MAGTSHRLKRIVGAYTINELGTWFGYVALAVGVYDHTHSAIATAALFLAARLIPAVLVPIVVARVEASPHRRELSGLLLVEAAATVALAILFMDHFWLPLVLLLVAIDGTAALTVTALLRTAAARVAAEDAPPVSVPGRAEEGQIGADELGARRANSALNLGFTPTMVIGPALAGVVVASFGAPTALFIDAASFVVCALLLLDLRPALDQESAGSVRERLAEAWSHIRGTPGLRTLLITQGVALIFFETIPPVEVIYARASLHAGDQGYGVLMGTWGVGMVIGSVVFARSSRRSLGPLLAGGTLTVGVGYLGMAAAPSLALACAASVVGGVGNGVQWVSFLSAVQQMTPANIHARMLSAVGSITSLAPAIGLTLGGLITAASSPRVAFWVAGGAATVATLAFVRVSVRGLVVERRGTGRVTPETGTLVH